MFDINAENTKISTLNKQNLEIVLSYSTVNLIHITKIQVYHNSRRFLSEHVVDYKKDRLFG